MKMKKLVAIALAGAMVLGSASMSFATEVTDPEAANGGTQGGGAFEGTVDTDVFTVVLPTTANTEADTVFDFIADPEGLIEETSNGAYTGATFSGDGSLYFQNASESGTAYSNTSDSLTITNKGTIAVDATVSASVSDNEGIALVSENSFAETDAAGMYLALADGTNTEVITADGATLTAEIAKAPDDAYELTYTDGDYVYGLTDAAKEDDYEGFTDYSFNITGNAGGDWSAVAEDVAPVINVTWEVVPHQDAPPTVACNLQTVVSGVGTDITSALALEKGVYIEIDGALSTADAADLTEVRINGTQITPATTGNSSGNSGAVYFKFPAETALESGDVITVVLAGTTYSFTLAS